jgi:hypothetical protein
MSNAVIKTLPELIARFGGVKNVSIVLRTTPQNVVNWRAKGRIPAIFYKVHRRWLAAATNRQIKVSDDLWGFEADRPFHIRRRRRKAEVLAIGEAAE